MHFYSATETSENRFNPQDPRGRKANPRITSFPEQIEITAANIAEHCLGANARPYTALEFREKTFEDGHKVKAYRDTEHFIQAEAAMGDVDHMPCSIDSALDPAPSLEEWQLQAAPLLKVPFKTFVTPSARYGAHTLSPYSYPVTDTRDCKALQIYVQSELAKSGVKGKCDEAVKDPARFFFPGPNVGDPSGWVLENDAPVIDVDKAIAAGYALMEGKGTDKAKRGRPKKQGRVELDLIREATTAGSRNKGCFALARYYGGITRSEFEARSLYNAAVSPQDDFPQEEVDRCFDNGYADCIPGSLISSPAPMSERSSGQFEEALETAVGDIQRECKRKYRIFSTLNFTSGGKDDPREDKDDPRWKSNRICRLEFTTPEQDRGYAVPLDSNVEFDTFVSALIARYEDSDRKLWLKLMDKRKAYFTPTILSSSGLILRHANEAQFLNGRLLFEEVEGEQGKVKPRFEPLQAGQFYTNVIPFEYETDNPKIGSPIWKYLTSWLSKRSGQKGRVSVELLFLADFFRSAMGGIAGNEQALIFDSRASYGKSTFVALQSKALTQTVVKKFSDSLLTTSPRFAWVNYVNSYVNYFMDPPVGRVVDSVQFKQVISSDEKNCELKGGAAWNQETNYRTEIFTNDMPKLSDPTDDGIRRRVVMIELWKKFTGERGNPPKELIKGFRQFICACLRLEPLPTEMRLDYPALKNWLSESCESDQFNELLIPEKGKHVRVSDLQSVLRAAGRPISRLDTRELNKLLKASGYVTKKWGQGLVIKGYKFNPQSAAWYDYIGEKIPSSHSDADLDDYPENPLRLSEMYQTGFNDDESAYAPAETEDDPDIDAENNQWKTFFDKWNPVIETFSIPFDPEPAQTKINSPQEEVQSASEPPLRLDVNQGHIGACPPENIQDEPNPPSSSGGGSGFEHTPFDCYPRGDHFDERQDFYDRLSAYLARNKGLTTIEGAKWCGSQWAKNILGTDVVPKLEVLRAVFPKTFWNFVDWQKTADEDCECGRFVLTDYKPANREEVIAYAFLTSFNETVRTGDRLPF